MDETCHWDILIFQPSCVLFCFLSSSDEAVSRILVTDLDAAVRLDRIFWSSCRCNLCIVWSARVRLRHLHILLINFHACIFSIFHSLFLCLALIFLFLRGKGKLAGLDLFRSHWYLAVKAYAVALGEEDMLIVVTVPVLLQHRWNLRGGITLVERFGVRDVKIARDTTVLRHFLMKGIEEEMCLVTVTDVASIKSEFEMGC